MPLKLIEAIDLGNEALASVNNKAKSKVDGIRQFFTKTILLEEIKNRRITPLEYAENGLPRLFNEDDVLKLCRHIIRDALKFDDLEEKKYLAKKQRSAYEAFVVDYPESEYVGPYDWLTEQGI